MRTLGWAVVVVALGCGGSGRSGGLDGGGDADADVDADVDASDGCNPGRERSWGACVDIDECARGTANCDELARCVNWDGGYSCLCPNGYEGDGHTCTDIDECATGDDDCAPDALCDNRPGSFWCHCPVGWTGDGQFCIEPCDGRDGCWVQSLGPQGRPVDVEITDSGTVIVASAGESFTLGEDALPGAGGADLFLAAISGEGLPLWAAGFGGAADESASALAVDAEEHAFVAGAYAGTTNLGGDDLVSAGGADAFLASYDSSGGHRWSLGFGSTGGNLFRPEDAHDVAVDGEGNVLIVGAVVAAVDLGGGVLDPISETGATDVYVASYGPDGGYRWARRFGGTAGTVGRGVAVDGRGNVYVTGMFGGATNLGADDLVSAGYVDAFLASYGPDGSHRWSHRFGSIREPDDDHFFFIGDIGFSLATDTQDNVYLTGVFTDAIDFGGGQIVGGDRWDGFVASFTSDGEHRWSRGLGGWEDDYANAVAVDDDDHVFVAGSFRGGIDFGDGAVAADGVTSAYLASYDSDGNYRWARPEGGGNGLGHSSGTSVAARGGTVVLVGTSDAMIFEGQMARNGGFVLRVPDF